MKVKVTYLTAAKRRFARRDVISCCKWLLLFAGFLCAVLNALIGGRAWSVIVIWSMWLVWAQLISPDMVEYNLISQFIKLTANCCVLLTLIDALLTPGWAVEAVPVICFSALLAVGILFFADFETQRQNMFPMLFLCIACLLGSVIGLVVWQGNGRWAIAVTGVCALSLLVGCAAKLGGAAVTEIKKRFCAK